MDIRRFIQNFWYFGLNQAYACVFGGYLLAIMVITSYWYPLESLHRYDFIFLAAVTFQLFLLATKLETIEEFIIIGVFHLVATVMEIFKTSDAIGSWTYPEDYFFGIANVPLFTGFMYSAVGSYIVRAWRIFDFQYSNYPKKTYTIILVLCIYLNFFTHHFIWDFRWVILMITLFLFHNTNVYYKLVANYHRMSLLLGWSLVALFIWFAENIATYANIWIYPNQTHEWHMVSISKISSWFLLILLSFVLVSLIHPVKKYKSSNV